MRSLLLWTLPLLSLSADQTSNLELYAKGVLAEQAQDWPKAREIYQRTLAQDSDCYPLVRKVANIQNLRLKNKPSFQDIPAATATLRAFAQKNRQHLSSQLHYASFLRQFAPDDEIARQAALDTLELADKNFPQNSAVFANLTSLYENLERRADSLRILERQLKSKSEDHSHWLSLIPVIKTLYQADDPAYNTQLDLAMSKVEEYGLHRADIARRVSEYHRERDRMDQALAALQTHLALAPSSHSLRTRLGILHLSNKNEIEGEKVLREVIAIDPEQALAHSSLAKLYTKRNELSLALHHRAEVLRIRGGNPEDAIEVADEYLALDQPHEARILLEKFRFDYPESPGIHARLAVATLRDGATQNAARLFRQAEALAEESEEEDAAQYLNADFLIEFAQSLIKADDLQAAETRLRQAAQGLDLDTQPKEYSRAITTLAKLWLDQNKNEAPAKALLQRALLLDPDNETASSLLE